DLTLYWPIYGYYEREKDTVCRRGDYYTNVSVGSLFGELLGFRFAQWLEESRGSRGEGALQIVEGGAHNGDLAKDILGWMRQQRRELFERLEYWIIEPSARRKQWQAQTLSE